jgi:DNA-binding PadR family transcriptional regulator
VTDDPAIRALLPLPRATFHVLLALQESPLHGYAVKQRVEEMSGGLIRMAPGTLYETLHRMRTRGMLEETEQPGAREHVQRMYYRMTPLGRAVLVAEVARLGGMIDRARSLLEEGT